MRLTPLTRPLGFVDFDGVWVDDPARCSWALQDLSLVLEPGSTGAVVDLDGTAVGAAVGSLLLGARRPVHGTLRFDGVDLRDVERDALARVVVELVERGEREPLERRFVVGGATTVITDGRPSSLERAGVVVLLYGGAEIARGTHAELLHAVPRYAARFSAVAA